MKKYVKAETSISRDTAEEVAGIMIGNWLEECYLNWEDYYDEYYADTYNLSNEDKKYVSDIIREEVKKMGYM